MPNGLINHAPTEQTMPSGSINASPTKIWQKSFYDHVIRNDRDLQRIEEYIYNNPMTWEVDSLNPGNVG